MEIHMEQHHGDGDYWSLSFIAQGFEFTEEDLTAVRRVVELSIGHEQQLLPLDQYDRPGGGPTRSYFGSWSRDDGPHRTNRLTVSCTKGQQPGPTAKAYHVLAERYPGARFTMYDMSLRQRLNAQGLNVVRP